MSYSLTTICSFSNAPISVLPYDGQFLCLPVCWRKTEILILYPFHRCLQMCVKHAYYNKVCINVYVPLTRFTKIGLKNVI